MNKLLVLVLIFCLYSNVVFAASSTDVLIDYGIVHGDPDGNLRLSDTITRAEFTKVIVEVASVSKDSYDTDSPFTDVPYFHWATKYICTAYKNGIIAGMSEGIFAPDSPVTNEQAVKMIKSKIGSSIDVTLINGQQLPLTIPL